MINRTASALSTTTHLHRRRSGTDIVFTGRYFSQPPVQYVPALMISY
jgi:hypothetical protein